jgi:hypothetical protein
MTADRYVSADHRFYPRHAGVPACEVVRSWCGTRWLLKPANEAIVFIQFAAVTSRVSCTKWAALLLNFTGTQKHLTVHTDSVLNTWVAQGTGHYTFSLFCHQVWFLTAVITAGFSWRALNLSKNEEIMFWVSEPCVIGKRFGRFGET